MEDQITQYIQNVLQRDPNPGEVESYVAIIDNNVATIEEVLDMIIDSAEAVNNVYPVVLTYQAIYGRVPDGGGLAYWTAVYKNNQGLDDPQTTTVNEALVEVLKAFVDPTLTPEFVTRYGANPSGDQFVAAAYQNVLNRTPDQGGLTYWQGRYAEIEASYANSGLSQDEINVLVRAQILEQFVSSTEYKDATADEVDAYLAAHARGEDTSGLSLWDFSDTTGQTFILTDGADLGAQPGQPFYGTDGDDTYVAGTTNSGIFAGNTLGTGDVLNGAGGEDTLQIIDNGLMPLIPRISNIENVEVQALGGPVEVIMTNATGVQKVENHRSFQDVTFNDVQEEAVVSVFDTGTDVFVNFTDGVDFGGDIHVAVNGANSNILISTDDAANLTTLHVHANGAASGVDIDIDDSAGFGGNTAPLENLIVDGDGVSLSLDDGFQDEEFEHLTSVDSTGFSGAFDISLAHNHEDVVFNGGDGDTWVDFGNGDNTVTTGAGDDYIGVDGTGNNTVDAGAGDDYVDFGSNANADDSADGGDGVDTIGIEVNTLAGLTASPAFEGSIEGFEKVHAQGVVEDGEAPVIDLANLDDISYVITDGTVEKINELRQYDLSSTAAEFGSFTIDIGGQTIQIDLPQGMSSSADAANAIVAAFLAGDFDAVDGLVNISIGADADNVVFELDSASTYPIPLFSINDSPVNYVVTNPSATPDTPGTNGTSEVQVLDVTTAPSSNGDITLTINGNNYVISVFGGENTPSIAQKIADALDAGSDTDIESVVVSGTEVTITYTNTSGDIADVVFTDTDTTGAVVDNTPGDDVTGVAATAETQVYTITVGNSAIDGRISIEGVVIDVPAGTDNEGLAGLIVDKLSEISAASVANDGEEIVNIIYNSALNELTFVYAQSAGDVDLLDIQVDNDADITATHLFGFYQAGQAGGVLTLGNMQNGGTLELDGANEGLTVIGLAANTANDTFNIILNAGIGDNTGYVQLDGVETLNVTQDGTVVTELGLDAADLVTLNVSGTAGVDFLGSTDFESLVTVNASALDVASNEAGVSIETDNEDGTTFIGSAGEDHFIGDDGNDVMTGGAGNDTLDGNRGNDTIDGGDGDDFIDGGLGADILTGGAGADTFYYNNVADSQGVTVDTITDFVSGEDKIDLSAITGGAGEYTGSANGYGAVLTSLTGTVQAVLDTSTNTLYIDVDGNAALDANDMAIDLTGVTSLNNADFVW